jgi:MFS family permease
MVGGALASRVRRLFRLRTDALLLGAVLTSTLLVAIGLTTIFPLALVLLATWCLVFAFTGPIRQSFINGLIPSAQRATVLSFDSLMSSAGGVIAQPALGRAADVWGYGQSYVIGGLVTALVIPFTLLARREHAKSDPITNDEPIAAEEELAPA